MQVVITIIYILDGVLVLCSSKNLEGVEMGQLQNSLPIKNINEFSANATNH